MWLWVVLGLWLGLRTFAQCVLDRVVSILAVANHGNSPDLFMLPHCSSDTLAAAERVRERLTAFGCWSLGAALHISAR